MSVKPRGTSSNAAAVSPAQGEFTGERTQPPKTCTTTAQRVGPDPTQTASLVHHQQQIPLIPRTPYNLDCFVTVDPESGTFFGANNAVVLDTRWLSPEELDSFNEGSDSDRAELCLRYGIYLEDLINPATLKNLVPDAQSNDQ